MTLETPSPNLKAAHTVGEILHNLRNPLSLIHVRRTRTKGAETNTVGRMVGPPRSTYTRQYNRHQIPPEEHTYTRTHSANWCSQCKTAAKKWTPSHYYKLLQSGHTRKRPQARHTSRLPRNTHGPKPTQRNMVPSSNVKRCGLPEYGAKTTKCLSYLHRWWLIGFHPHFKTELRHSAARDGRAKILPLHDVGSHFSPSHHSQSARRSASAVSFYLEPQLGNCYLYRTKQSADSVRSPSHSPVR